MLGKKDAVERIKHKEIVSVSLSTTNRENTGLISVDRSNKATLLLTIPSSVI